MRRGARINIKWININLRKFQRGRKCPVCSKQIRNKGNKIGICSIDFGRENFIENINPKINFFSIFFIISFS